MSEALRRFNDAAGVGHNKQRFEMKCPAHDDDNPSLSVGVGEGGKLLLHCHAGCTYEEVLSAVNLSPSDLMSKVHHLNEEYDYIDLKGNHAFQVVRMPDKNFRQRRKVANGYEWGRGSAPLLLYRLPSIAKAISEGRDIYVVEGEKDVHTLERAGFAATTNPMGAGKFKPQLAEQLRGANRVIVIPDNDDVGRDHAKYVAECIHTLVKEVKIVALPVGKKGEDTSDWFEYYGGTPGKLKALVDSTPALSFMTEEEKQLEAIIGGGFTARELQAMELEPIRWAIPDILPEGATLMAGKPKTGKSFFALNIGVAVASGGRALGKIQVDKGRVLFLQLEGSKKGLKSRLDPLMQGDEAPDMLHFYPEWPTIKDGGLVRLKKWLSYYKDTSLVIIDTFKVIRGNTGTSKSLYDEDYNSLKPFAELAEEMDVAILLIHHTNKMSDVEDPFDLVSGSTGLMASVDTGMVLRRNPNHEGVDLFIRGRDTEEVEYSLKFDPVLKTWIHQGSAEEFSANSTKHTVLHVLKSLDYEETIGPKEMASRAEISYDVAAQTLKRLVEDGLAVRAGRGNYKQHPVNFVNFVKKDEMSTNKDTSKRGEVDSAKTLSTSLSTSETPHTSQNQRNHTQFDKVDRVDSTSSAGSDCPF